jgi:hypothetical protein
MTATPPLSAEQHAAGGPCSECGHPRHRHHPFHGIEPRICIDCYDDPNRDEYSHTYQGIGADQATPQLTDDQLATLLRALTNEVKQLRAENEAMRAVQRVHVAGFEAVLLIADRDPDAAISSGAWHEAIGYNAALSDVRDAIVPAAAPTATT